MNEATANAVTADLLGFGFSSINVADDGAGGFTIRVSGGELDQTHLDTVATNNTVTWLVTGAVIN